MGSNPIALTNDFNGLNKNSEALRDILLVGYSLGYGGSSACVMAAVPLDLMDGSTLHNFAIRLRLDSGFPTWLPSVARAKQTAALCEYFASGYGRRDLFLLCSWRMGKLEDLVGNRWLRLTAVGAQIVVLLKAIGAAVALFFVVDNTCGRPAAIFAILTALPFVIADVWKEAVKLLEEIAKLRATGPIVLPRVPPDRLLAQLMAFMILPLAIVAEWFWIVQKLTAGGVPRRPRKAKPSFDLSRLDVALIAESDRIVVRESFKPTDFVIALRRVDHITPLPPHRRNDGTSAVVPIEGGRRKVARESQPKSQQPAGSASSEPNRRPLAPWTPRVDLGAPAISTRVFPWAAALRVKPPPSRIAS